MCYLFYYHIDMCIPDGMLCLQCVQMQCRSGIMFSKWHVMFEGLAKVGSEIGTRERFQLTAGARMLIPKCVGWGRF